MVLAQLQRSNFLEQEGYFFEVDVVFPVAHFIEDVVQFGEERVDGAVVEISLVLGLEFDVVEVGLHIRNNELLLWLAVISLAIFVDEYFNEVIQQAF